MRTSQVSYILGVSFGFLQSIFVSYWPYIFKYIVGISIICLNSCQGYNLYHILYTVILNNIATWLFKI